MLGPMTKEEIDELKEFAKVAINVLCQNPIFMDAKYQQQLQIRKITMESMAVGIACNTVNQIQGIVEMTNKKRVEDGNKITPIIEG